MKKRGKKKGNRKRERSAFSDNPGQGARFNDAGLRQRIRNQFETLGGRAEASDVFDACHSAGLFPEQVVMRWARRGGIEYIREALGENDHTTGFPFAHAIPGTKAPVWIQETLMSDTEYTEMLNLRTKALGADYGEYRRLRDRGVSRYGEDRMPPLVQMDFPL